MRTEGWNPTVHQRRSEIATTGDIPLFADLPIVYAEEFASRVKLQSIAKRGTIYQAGEEANAVYAIVQGLVKISRILQDGRELGYAVLSRGDVFGELEILNGTLRQDQATVLDRAQLLILPRCHFYELINASPSLSVRLAKLVGRRLGRLQAQLSDLAFQTVQTRLARLLVYLADTIGCEDCDGLHLRPRITHQELATLIASTRETVSLTLGQFRSRLLIDFNSREIRILDRQALLHQC